MKDEEEDNNITEPESQVMDFSKPDFIFTPGDKHEWRQQGPYCVCKTCLVEHAQWIGMDKLLVGIAEDGTMILEDR